jgi:hypothetical protein
MTDFILGKNSRIEVGAANPNIVVNGVIDVTNNQTWKTDTRTYLGDTAERTIPIEKNWNVPLNMDELPSDPGQQVLRDASQAGSNVAVKIWNDYTNANTKYYVCLYGICLDYSTKNAGGGAVGATCTIKSNGTAMTPPS